jgi:hypothetical protein
MTLETAASGPGGHFLRLINSKNLYYYKFNQKTRSIHVFTFLETQNPDRLDTFDFDKLTLKSAQWPEWPWRPLLLVLVAIFCGWSTQGAYKNINSTKKSGRSMFLTFRETQNSDRLDTFDFDKLTLKIITSARKQQPFQFFAKKWTMVMCNFAKLVKKQKSYAILNDRLETFDRYCT